MIKNNKCCINCFSESEIINFIESEGIIGNCDYCKSRKVSICDVVEVGSFIMEGIERHYEDAAHHVGYASSDGGYLLATQEIDEILSEEYIFGENLDDPDVLLKDLVSNDGTAYVRKDPYGPPSGNPEEIRYWDDFCENVKTKQRFTNFLTSKDDDQYDHSQPRNFLFHLAHNFMPTLIDVFEPGRKIYRARIYNEEKNLSHEDMTSPLPQRSRNSRMSPAGISFFYGGLTNKVCIHEVRPSLAEKVIVAKFEVIKRLRILNLATTFESRKSIFDPEYNFFHEEYFKPFLEHFVDDIAKPIRKTDNEIEYTPTQVFIEFIKTINFKTPNLLQGDNGKERDVFIDGVLFKSSVMKNGINLVLFRGPEISTTNSVNPKDAWLLYKGNTIRHVTGIKVNSQKIEAQSSD